MGEHSKIEWCDHTFNPWIGCSKVSEGCANCYAEREMDHRLGKAKWGPEGTRVRTSAAYWRKPLQWAKAARESGTRPRVFCASLADVWEDRPELCQWRRELLALIAATPELDWLILTKRPENIMRMVRTIQAEADAQGDPLGGQLYEWARTGRAWSHVWLGVSVENQETADERIPHLLKLDAAVRFLSCEPLLGPVDLEEWMGGYYCAKCCRHFATTARNAHCPSCGNEHAEELCPECGEEEYENICPKCGIDGGNGGLDHNDCWLPDADTMIHWIICGGESGPKARPMHPDWARALRDQCLAAGVPFFFKQWGEWCPQSVACSEKAAETALYLEVDGSNRDARFGTRGEAVTIQRVGKKAAGRILDGRRWDEFPKHQAEVAPCE